MKTVIFCTGLALIALGARAAAAVGDNTGGHHAVRPPVPRVYLSCRADNDLFKVLTASGLRALRFDHAAEAIESAEAGAGVMILADGYPQQTTSLDATAFAEAARKKLRLYVEFPSFLPGLQVAPPRPAGKERAVTVSGFFGADLPSMRLLEIHGLTFTPVEADKVHLAVARVAGFDTAVFGLPREKFPLLFELPGGAALIATSKLSDFVTGRYAPSRDWRTVWQGVLGWLCPEMKMPELKWTPTVRPAYGREDVLPVDGERMALMRGMDWFVKSKLLLHASQTNQMVTPARGVGRMAPPPDDAPTGDGTLGIMEARLSIIRRDGSQMISAVRRGDCHGESAMALALGGKVCGDPKLSEIARNLLDYYLFASEARKGGRGDPEHPAYGLIAWGISDPAWLCANYGDDSARMMLGTLATAAVTGEDRWDEAMMLCLLANFRTTGPSGFREERIDMEPLQANGWQHYFQQRSANGWPGINAYLWACYLWAYDKTKYEPFFQRAETGIRMTMKAHADGWPWGCSIAGEPARMLLPLAWLVRVQDTPEHRAWLRTVVDDLLKLQQPCGAIRDAPGAPGKGVFPPVRSNEKYGRTEAPLFQTDGDPVCDQLYANNFALWGLHEAAAATGEKDYLEAERRLADFLCRIQIRSDAHPSLDGGWFRAFDFKRWEAWGSNADAGWGAWVIESGWSQSWITSVLALRQMRTSFWDLTAGSKIARHFETQRKLMLPDLNSDTPTI